MADLVQTAANVLADPSYTGNQKIEEQAGEAIDAGMPVYQTSAANSYWFKANSFNGFLSGNVNGARLALSEAAGPGQPLVTLKTGRVNLGATLEAGEVYAISLNTGKIRPYEDMLINEFTVVLGFAGNTTHLTMPAAGALVTNIARAANARI
jgi:hypothetical protein